jgi:hypothetical protein
LGGAEERKINRVVVESIWRSILFYFMGKIHILTSKKMEVEIIIPKYFF